MLNRCRTPDFGWIVSDLDAPCAFATCRGGVLIIAVAADAAEIELEAHFSVMRWLVLDDMKSPPHGWRWVVDEGELPVDLVRQVEQRLASGALH